MPTVFLFQMFVGLRWLSKRFFSSVGRNSLNSFCQRTHTCGELRKEHVGQKVEICGWLQYSRMNRFFVLRDSYGSIQVFLNPKKLSAAVMELAKDLPYESVLKIQGEVVERPKGQANLQMLTGEIELSATAVEVLNVCQPQLPFQWKGDHNVSEFVLMKYRYIHLRSIEMQQRLKLRAQLVKKIRSTLDEFGFLEVETPTLFRRTPGGAAEFIVPSSSDPGHFYCLPQSPQQFKQLLMVGGVDRYYQVS